MAATPSLTQRDPLTDMGTRTQRHALVHWALSLMCLAPVPTWSWTPRLPSPKSGGTCRWGRAGGCNAGRPVGSGTEVARWMVYHVQAAYRLMDLQSQWTFSMVARDLPPLMQDFQREAEAAQRR